MLSPFCLAASHWLCVFFGLATKFVGGEGYCTEGSPRGPGPHVGLRAESLLGDLQDLNMEKRSAATTAP